MYIAYGSIEDDQHHGSTKLHIDMTDAVNIMVWSSGRHEPRHSYALWRIFPQAASSVISDFLRDTGFSGSGQPIHSQTVYFTETMLKELEARHGIRPFTIRQFTGEAIFIPAGCAHQVQCS
jgi:JmjC domain, hydroxylase